MTIRKIYRRLSLLAAGVGLAWLLGRLIAPRHMQASKTRLRRVQASVEIAALPQRVFATIVDPRKPFITSNPFVRMELGSDRRPVWAPSTTGITG